MHDFGADEEFFRFFFGDLAGALRLLLGAHPLVLLNLAQFIGQGIGLAFHLLCQCTGLGTGCFQLVFALLNELVPLFAGGIQLMCGLVAQLFNFVLAFLQLQLQIVELAQNGIQTFILGGKVLLCGLNDSLRDAQLFADEERVRFARHADAELVGRAQGLKVELAAGVDNALGFQRKDLQFGIVGGSHQQHAAAAEFLDDGHGQRCTLSRVGTGTQLVQKNEGVRHSQFQNAGDLLHVAGEGGQALFDALFVADVHEELVKHADLTALVGGDQKAALRHGAKQAGCFQRNGLTAGVRTGDDERIVLPAQCYIHRNALFRVDERMTRPDEGEGRIRPDSGLESLQIQRQPRLCQQNVDLQHGFVAVLELRLDRGHLRGKSHEDALDLLRFLRAVLQNAGVGFHNSLRLDEDGSTRRRNIVDDAADFAAVLALNRDNIAPISHGNDALLQIFGGVHVTDHALQPVADAVLGDADLFAQLVQGMGSCIRHGVWGQNGTGDLLLQTGLWCQRIK